ncbi:hypothetical protein ACGRHY_26695 [Streptomyces sp. HK10]|uniref:hypothetical protein n=1 Tax=Streptomyces sp. HK10 TaxID=3373255 RepID=UPI0037484741
MSRIVDVVLLAVLTFTALAWALDRGSRKTHLMIATGVVLALDAVVIWQDKPWYVCAGYGGLTGLLLPALRRESIRRKAAKTVSEPRP